MAMNKDPIILDLLSDDEKEAFEFQEEDFEEEETIASMSENVKKIQTKLNQIEVLFWMKFLELTLLEWYPCGFISKSGVGQVSFIYLNWLTIDWLCYIFFLIYRELDRLESQKEKLKRDLKMLDKVQVENNVDWSATTFPWADDIEKVKEEKFGIYSPFRPNQRECINASLSGKDCFVVMVSFFISYIKKNNWDSFYHFAAFLSSHLSD